MANEKWSSHIISVAMQDSFDQKANQASEKLKQKSRGPRVQDSSV